MVHKLYFEKSIKQWDEAIPLGNGRLGALIWGGPEALRFSLDRTDIWDLSVPLNTEREDFTYANMVKLAKEGNTSAIRELFDAPYNYPTPTKLPAGKLQFCFQQGINTSSLLKLETAEARLEILTEQGSMPMRAICHAVSRSGMIWIGANYQRFQMELIIPAFGSDDEKEEQHYDPEEREISQGSLEKLHYPIAERFREEGHPNFRWFTQKVDDRFSFGIVVGILEQEKETLVFYRVVTSKDGENWIEDAKEQLRKELTEGYEKNLESHKIWWKDFWTKSAVSLPDKFFEKNWYLTNYLFASCSRKGEFPMPLQGVWTADDGNLPPWKGDYHNDLNTQLSYSHFYKANHLEEGETFIDFLWNSLEAGRTFAKKFFGTEGICLPGVMSIDGKALGGWPMYSLSPTHQIWLCQSFALYYHYTGDAAFLRDKAWVYFEETAKCITSLLEERDGHYYLPVSSSPEIHDDEKESWVTPNSNYDLALLRYLYRTLIEFAKILENGQDKKWQQIYEKLPELAINEKQILMISPDESLKESHRHLSNAMAICPLELYQYDREKEIIDATILDYELLGTGMWVGFSFAWMSHLYSVQKNGEGAYEQLRIFWESFCSPNGFHLNGDYKKRGYTTFHYRPFTLEANMYAADALQEMLFQMKNGVLELFPAVPEKWREQKIIFKSFRGENGILVSAKWLPDKGIEAEIFAEKEQTIHIRNSAGRIDEIHLQKGNQTFTFFQ